MAGSSRPQRITALVFAPVHAFELAVACEVFGVDRSAMGVPRFDFRVASVEPGELPTIHGFTMNTRHGLEAVRRADLVILPGWPRSLDEVPDEAALEALRVAYRRGARVASFCSGAFVLAAAGLLDGRLAATHWMYTDELSRRYPDVEVDPHVLYLGDGQVFTSAGTAAAIDLSLHLVRLDHGAEVANVVARRMIVPPHRQGCQAQYVETPLPEVPATDDLAATLDWAVGHLDQPITVADLADRTRMSPRTFARHFRETLGTTPLQWLVVQRVLLAQRLLETTELPIDVVAQRSGFGTAANLRLHVGRRLGLSPSDYRETFRRTATLSAVAS
jgi:transcriptional regulator GlxA family with amidase domain